MSIQAMRQALEAAESMSLALFNMGRSLLDSEENAIENLRAAIEQAEKCEPTCYLREEWMQYVQASESDPHAFPVFMHPQPTIPEGWQGCGECDCEFPCNEGNARCIRLAAAPEPEEKS